MCTNPYVKTPVGDVKVGDVVCFFRTATIVKFGTVAILKPDNKIFIKQCFGVKYSEDNKQSRSCQRLTQMNQKCSQSTSLSWETV